MYAFAYEPELTVTQDCLGPRTNSGVPERSILLGVPRSVAVLMGSGIVLVLLAWVGSFESGACECPWRRVDASLTEEHR
jgi:hypothetical protein